MQKRLGVLKNLVDYGFLYVKTGRALNRNLPLLNREIISTVTYSDLYKSGILFKQFIQILEKSIRNPSLKIKLVLGTKSEVKLVNHFIKKNKSLSSRIFIYTNVIQYNSFVNDVSDSLIIDINNSRFSAMLNRISSQEESGFFISVSNNEYFVYNENYNFVSNNFSSNKRVLLLFIAILTHFSKDA